MQPSPNPNALSATQPKDDDWGSLIFGVYGRNQIDPAVADAHWQQVRIGLKGTTMRYRFKVLNTHLERQNYCLEAKIQVTNYVNALKRGGMLDIDNKVTERGLRVG
jgi:hypothetical protein